MLCTTASKSPEILLEEFCVQQPQNALYCKLLNFFISLCRGFQTSRFLYPLIQVPAIFLLAPASLLFFRLQNIAQYVVIFQIFPASRPLFSPPPPYTPPAPLTPGFSPCSLPKQEDPLEVGMLCNSKI